MTDFDLSTAKAVESATAIFPPMVMFFAGREILVSRGDSV